MLLINAVIRGVVKAENDITLDAVHVGDEQIAYTRSIWYKVCFDALRLDVIFPVWHDSATIAYDGLSGVILSSSGCR